MTEPKFLRGGSGPALLGEYYLLESAGASGWFPNGMRRCVGVVGVATIIVHRN